MKRRWAAIAVLVLVLAAVAFRVLWKRGAPGGATASGDVHREAAPGLDHANAPGHAMFEAPEGSTPCETAYNAYKAFDDTAKEIGRPTPWASMPDKPRFLANCARLPEAQQRCMQPKYGVQHHPECDPLLEAMMKDLTVFK